MFSPGALSFVCIVLFMVHEFEEIICVRPYIERHKGDSRFSGEMFIAGGNRAYPSTETVALMIAEEFVLASLVMLAGVATGSTELVLAPFAAFALHLVPHVSEAARFPGWAPGSRTAVALLLPSLALIAAAVAAGQADLVPLVLWTLPIGAVLLLNLRGMHALAGKIETSRQKG